MVAVATRPCVPTFARVPKDFPGGTILCVASGPSLTPEDVEYCRGRVEAAVVVNTSYQLVPWAHALYAADAQWWDWHKGAPRFSGSRYSVSTEAAKWGVSILRNTGKRGLELSPDGLKTGQNSGYQAIGLAKHLIGERGRIVLLGYDLQPSGKRHHWHADHPNSVQPPAYLVFRDSFAALIQPMAELGISVVNCTRSTALTCFPCRPLREVLP